MCRAYRSSKSIHSVQILSGQYDSCGFRILLMRLLERPWRQFPEISSFSSVSSVMSSFGKKPYVIWKGQLILAHTHTNKHRHTHSETHKHRSITVSPCKTITELDETFRRTWNALFLYRRKRIRSGSVTEPVKGQMIMCRFFYSPSRYARIKTPTFLLRLRNIIDANVGTPLKVISRYFQHFESIICSVDIRYKSYVIWKEEFVLAHAHTNIHTNKLYNCFSEKSHHWTRNWYAHFYTGEQNSWPGSNRQPEKWQVFTCRSFCVLSRYAHQVFRFCNGMWPPNSPDLNHFPYYMWGVAFVHQILYQ